MSDKPFQTRSDSFGGNYPGTEYFHTLSEAVCAYKEDNSIWKISWTDSESGTRYRIRPKYSLLSARWGSLSEHKLQSLCSSYADAPEHKLFWVYQSIDAICDEIVSRAEAGITKKMTEEEEEEQCARCLINMWTDENLLKVFNENGSKKE